VIRNLPFKNKILDDRESCGVELISPDLVENNIYSLNKNASVAKMANFLLINALKSTHKLT